MNKQKFKSVPLEQLEKHWHELASDNTKELVADANAIREEQKKAHQRKTVRVKSQLP